MTEAQHRQSIIDKLTYLWGNNAVVTVRDYVPTPGSRYNGTHLATVECPGIDESAWSQDGTTEIQALENLLQSAIKVAWEAWGKKLP